LERLARELTPATEGLVLRPTLKKTLAARRAKLKFLTTKLSTKVSSLDNTKCKRGRRKLDWKFRNRVGFKAAQFRKVTSVACRCWLVISYVYHCRHICKDLLLPKARMNRYYL